VLAISPKAYSISRWEGFRFVVVAAGVAVIIAGLVQIRQAYREDYREDLKTGEMSSAEQRAISTSAKVGLYARGVVFPVIGIYLIKSGLSENAAYSNGVGGALNEIATSDAGPVGLALVSLGLAAYGVYMVASAEYRKVNA